MKTSIGPSASRRIKSLRMKGSRSTFSRSDGDHIPLDLTRNPNDILKEILANMCNRQGITTARKLGHLNNLVRLYCSIEDDSMISIPIEVIMSCLKATLVSDVKEVRAAGVRALRYIINDNKSKETFTNLHLDHLITKCLDISHFNEVERIQAIRLIRKLAHLKRSHSSITEPIVPLSLFACIVSVSLGGAEERDRVYRTCLAVLCELAVMQPYLLLKSNGVLALINAILECHMYHRISECLCMSLMHLIDHPTVRENNRSELNMGATFAPFTELNYRLHPDVEDAKLKDEQEMRFMASKMAIVSLLRTWSGMLHICNSDSMVRSFVEALLIPSPSVRRGIMAVLCDLFYFNELNWTDDFDMALNSAAPGNFKDTWRLTEGFVVAEGKCLLPVRAVARPDLVDCQLAVLLSAFLNAGLLQSLATVSLSSDSCSSVAATILLGTVLHLASRLLPGDSDNSSRKWHLPDLLRTWSSEQTDEQLRINIAVKQLQEIHVMLRSKTPAVHSLYLTQLLSDLPREHTSPRRISGSGLSSSRSRSNSSSSSHDALTSPTFSLLKRHRTLNLMRDFTEDHTLAAIKHTKVLSTTENREWDWEALECLFLSPPSLHFLRSVATDDTLRRFYRRLIFFFLPSNKLFSSIDLAKDGLPDHNRKYVTTACHMVQFLAHSDEEGQRLLKDMITTIVDWLQETTSEASGYSRSTGSLLVTCSREYFLIMGSLSCDPRGDQVLGHCKVYHYFLGLASESANENLIKLMVSSLHYSEDSPSRAVLNKVLTSCNEAGRLYGTGFLRVLLRANCPGFKGWGTDLLTTQLFDPSNDVAAEALDILHEACDDREYLQAVVKLKPTLLHLGERGAILVCRFLSEPQGFAYLSRNKYLARELDRWWKSYNERYVIHVEELLKLSLTTYERPNKEDGFVRRSGHRKGRQSVYLPAHLYGELCRHEEGARVVEEEQIAPKLTRLLLTMLQEESRKKVRSKEGGTLLKMKSCLWALAHIGSTALGLPLLQKCDALPMLARLASGAGVASVRGTSIYCLNCVAQTIPGVEALRQFGWKSVLRTVNRPETRCTSAHNRTSNLEQDATPRMTRSNPLSKSVSMSSQWSTVSGSPRAHSGQSPRRSTSSASATSTGRISRSRGSSRTEGGSMHKIKRRNSKKSSLQEDILLPSPSSTSASTSVVSSHSSISEVDGIAGYPATTKLGNSPSPTHAPLVVKPSPRPNKKDHRRTRSTADDLTSRDSLSVTSSKTRIKDRVIELFFKRSKNRSSVKTPNDVIERKKQQDDSSSGYVSDHHPFDHADWRSLDQSSSLIEEPDDDAPPSPLRHAHSALANQQLASSVDTLKVCDVIEVTSRQAQIKRNSSDFSLKTDLSVTPCNAGGEMSLLSTWNTNNSGQSESVIQNGGERTRAASRFYLAPTEPPEPPGQRFHRARSLPDVLDARSPRDRNNRHLADDVISRRNHERNAGSGESPRNFAENRALTDLVNSSAHWRRSDGHFQKSNPPDHFPSPLYTQRPAPDHCDVIERDASPPKPSPAEGEGVKGGLGSELRNRGNTEVSHDSGYGLESSPVAVTSSVDDAPATGDVTPGTDDPFYDAADWRLSKPTGLAAVRIFNQHTTSPVADIRKTLQDVSERFPDTLDSDEREEIVRTTRYVGIAVPDHLEHIFQPLDGKTAKNAKSPSNLLSDWKGLIEDDGLPDMNPGRRKVNELLQGRKFRGLDEYTFGPAVAAALKASSSKQGKSHSTANTPCARTPDSIMSEASDLCYLGGHTMEPGSDEYVAILHQEIVQLVTNLGSSVGIKAHETALLMMKEKRPEVFDSLSLYNSIVEIMSQYSFRLTTRRFVQELFQDVHFTEVYFDAQRALQSIK